MADRIRRVTATALRFGQRCLYLQNRIEACYPFHPATLSVFQRKWQPLPQYQQVYRAAATSLEFMSMVMVHPEVPRNSNGAGLGPRR